MIAEVSRTLQNANIGTGERPGSDWAFPKSEYVSFRRDYNDLVDPAQAKRRKEDARTEDEFKDSNYISEKNADYPKHKEMMRGRPLYKELLKIL